MRKILSKRRRSIKNNGITYIIEEMSGAMLEKYVECLEKIDFDETMKNDMSAEKLISDVVFSFVINNSDKGKTELMPVELAMEILKLQAVVNDIDLICQIGDDWPLQWVVPCIRLGILFGKTPQEIWDCLSPGQIALMMRYIFDQGQNAGSELINGDTRKNLDLRQVTTEDQWRRVAGLAGSFGKINAERVECGF